MASDITSLTSPFCTLDLNSPPHSPASSHEMSSPNLLGIPLELRLQIYTLVLEKTYGWHNDTYLSISLVSHQIRAEILPLILSTEKYFRSLDQFSEWVYRGKELNEGLLWLVGNLTMHIGEESLGRFESTIESTGEERRGKGDYSVEDWEQTHLYSVNGSNEPLFGGRGVGGEEVSRYENPFSTKRLDTPLLGASEKQASQQYNNPFGTRTSNEENLGSVEAHALIQEALPSPPKNPNSPLFGRAPLISSSQERSPFSSPFSLATPVPDSRDTFDPILAGPLNQNPPQFHTPFRMAEPGATPLIPPHSTPLLVSTPAPPPANTPWEASWTYPVYHRAALLRARELLPKSIIAKTWLSLHLLPSLRKFWIQMPANSRVEEQDTLLFMLSMACPSLQKLTIFVSPKIHLSYLCNFPKLGFLRWTGYSLSTPQDALTILKGQTSLDAVSIFKIGNRNGQEEGEASGERFVHGRRWESVKNSFTPEVLEGMNPLKLFEIMHLSGSVASQHLTVPMIYALEAHKSSLKTLRITSEFPVEEDVFLVLVQLLKDWGLERRIKVDFELLIEQRFMDQKHLTWFHEQRGRLRSHLSCGRLDGFVNLRLQTRS